MLFTSFTYHYYRALLLRSMSVLLHKGYRKKKKKEKSNIRLRPSIPGT